MTQSLLSSQALTVSDKLDILEASVATDELLTLDTELRPLGGISVCNDTIAELFKTGFYFPVAHPQCPPEMNILPLAYEKLVSIILKADKWGMHNAPYDLAVLQEARIDYRGYFYDSMSLAHWLDENRFLYSLDAVSKSFGHPPKNKSQTMQNIIDTDGWEYVPVGMMDEYSSHDAYITHLTLKDEIALIEKEFPSELWEVEQQFIRDVIIPMVRLGIQCDLEFSLKEYMRGTKIMDSLQEELGGKPSSPKFLKKLLIDELKLPVLATSKKTGAPSFTKKEMAEYDVLLQHKNDPRARNILTYRGWQKTCSSNYKAYLDLCDASGVLHPGYKLHGTRTGRMSCEKPNLQQIPKSTDKDWNGNLKAAFVPREGFDLWTIDYSQLQFRMAVSYAGQQELIAIFNDEARDIFYEMAADKSGLLSERQNIKTLVYLMLFGGGGGRAQAAFGLSTIEEGGELVAEFYSHYPELKAISRECQAFATKYKFVSYWTGRRRHFPKIMFNNKDIQKYYRAFNAVIQGGEAEIMKRAMIAVQQQVCDENFRIVLQIHDEIAFEVKQGMSDYYMPMAQKIMEDTPKAFCDFTGNYVAFKCSPGLWGAK